ncbi:MAG: 23S rRNA (pseudouridine(1915)-N(3))-methyltransferase RlmH [bacterium]
MLAVGRLKDPAVRDLIQTYQDRLRPFVQLRVEEVRDFPVRKGMNPKVAVDCEGEFLQERLPEDSYYVVLDEKGKQKTTEDWADLFRRWENEGKKEVTFLIGGAYGVSESLLRGAREKLALSKLTFTHDMARFIFMEQVYRVYTVLRGVPYHHG